MARAGNAQVTKPPPGLPSPVIAVYVPAKTNHMVSVGVRVRPLPVPHPAPAPPATRARGIAPAARALPGPSPSPLRKAVDDDRTRSWIPLGRIHGTAPDRRQQPGQRLLGERGTRPRYGAQRRRLRQLPPLPRGHAVTRGRRAGRLPLRRRMGPYRARARTGLPRRTRPLPAHDRNGLRARPDPGRDPPPLHQPPLVRPGGRLARRTRGRPVPDLRRDGRADPRRRRMGRDHERTEHAGHHGRHGAGPAEPAGRRGVAEPHPRQRGPASAAAGPRGGHR